MTPSTELMPWMPADWLASDALVVGYLTVRSDGVAFRSLVPNPTRAIELQIEQIERVATSSATGGAPRALEIFVRGEDKFVFLVEDPRACVLVVEQALAIHAARSAYR